jgi:dihydroflavonol-4-reductase
MHIVAGLLRAGDSVKAMYRSDKARGRLEAFLDRHLTAQERAKRRPDRLTWVKADLRDGASIERALEGVVRVYHTAAVVSFHPSDTVLMKEVNQWGTSLLVDLMLDSDVRDWVYVSSVATLGIPRSGPVHANVPFDDGDSATPYARTKYFAERSAFRGHAEGLPVVIVNPTVIIGDGDFSKSSSAMFRLVDKGLSRFPTGATGFVAAADVAHACIMAAAGSGSRPAASPSEPTEPQRYLLSAENRTFQDVLTTIARALDRPAPSRPLPPALIPLIWRSARFYERITGRRTMISRDGLGSSAGVQHYRSSELPFTYTPIDDVISETAQNYRQQFPPQSRAPKR